MMTLEGFRPKWSCSNRYSHSICLEVKVLAEIRIIHYRIQIWWITAVLTC